MAIQITFAQYVAGMPVKAYQELIGLYHQNTTLMHVVNAESQQAMQDLSEEERLGLTQGIPQHIEQ